MATQGLVTVVKNGQVVMKVIAGINGMNGSKLVRKIKRKKDVPTLAAAYKMALSVEFGDPYTLVVIGQKGSVHNIGSRLSRLYRRTFSQAEFNPRWKYGIADHVFIVNF